MVDAANHVISGAEHHWKYVLEGFSKGAFAVRW
jgi:hypothetical protein